MFFEVNRVLSVRQLLSDNGLLALDLPCNGLVYAVLAAASGCAELLVVEADTVEHIAHRLQTPAAIAAEVTRVGIHVHRSQTIALRLVLRVSLDLFRCIDLWKDELAALAELWRGGPGKSQLPLLIARIVQKGLKEVKRLVIWPLHTIIVVDGPCIQEARAVRVLWL